jgi:hypothetical protein
MDDTKKVNESAGCLAYVVGGMSFIPLIGVIFGLVAIIWGFKIKHLKLKIVGFSGILFTVVIYGALGYFGFVQKGGVYDDLRVNLAQSQMTTVVQALELYKVQNGQYPESLKILEDSLSENSFVFLYDPTLMSLAGKQFFYYKIISENQYHVRALGRDGELNTEDDVFPSPIDNVGLVVNYDVMNDM